MMPLSWIIFICVDKFDGLDQASINEFCHPPSACLLVIEGRTFTPCGMWQYYSFAYPMINMIVISILPLLPI